MPSGIADGLANSGPLYTNLKPATYLRFDGL